MEVKHDDAGHIEFFLKVYEENLLTSYDDLKKNNEKDLQNFKLDKKELEFFFKDLLKRILSFFSDEIDDSNKEEIFSKIEARLGDGLKMTLRSSKKIILSLPLGGGVFPSIFTSIGFKTREKKNPTELEKRKKINLEEYTEFARIFFKKIGFPNQKGDFFGARSELRGWIDSVYVLGRVFFNEENSHHELEYQTRLKKIFKLNPDEKFDL